MKMAYLSVLATVFLVPAAWAQQDCELTDRYLGMAHERIAEYEYDEAIQILQAALSQCQRYDIAQLLAEHTFESSVPEHKEIAVDAILVAEMLAPSDEALALTLFRYATLLSLDGDPQNAWPLAIKARSLNPDDPAIAELWERLDEQISNSTDEQFRAGLQQYLLKAPLSGESRGFDATPGSNVPLNFKVGEVELDEKTKKNVSTLANALANPDLEGQRFLFVGHADKRGSREANEELSVRRAEAIRDDVVKLKPSLAGRIDAEGRGSSEPLDDRNNEEAYQANRRVQVFQKE